MLMVCDFLFYFVLIFKVSRSLMWLWVCWDEWKWNIMIFFFFFEKWRIRCWFLIKSMLIFIFIFKWENDESMHGWTYNGNGSSICRIFFNKKMWTLWLKVKIGKWWFGIARHMCFCSFVLMKGNGYFSGVKI